MKLLKITTLAVLLSFSLASLTYAKSQAELEVDALLKSIEAEAQSKTAATKSKSAAPKKTAPTAKAKKKPAAPKKQATEVTVAAKPAELSQDFTEAFPNNEVLKNLEQAKKDLQTAKKYYADKNYAAASQYLDKVLNFKFRRLISEVYYYKGLVSAAEKKDMQSLQDFVVSITTAQGDIQILNPEISYQQFTKNGGKNYANYVDGALDTLRKLAALPDITSQTKAYYYFLMGQAYKEQGDIENAIDSFDRSTRLYGVLGYVYGARGFAKQLRANPTSVDNLDAIRDFDRALRLESNADIFYNARGIVKSSLQNYTQAIEDFTKAIKNSPSTAEYYLNRYNAYLKLNLYTEAKKDYATYQYLTDLLKNK
jgi:tetratricopeptide (TPR) repeat protein